MKVLTSLLFYLFFFPFGANAYIPDKAIAFSSEQLSVGKMLVASNNIKGSIFEKSVILLTHHDQGGDMGLIINKPSMYQVREVYPGFVMDGDAGRLFVGGPVISAVLSVLQKRNNDAGVEGLKGVLPHIFHRFVSPNDNPDIYFSADVERVRFYSGYAGWGKGQLIREINQGGWYVIDGDPSVVFDDNADSLWQTLMRRVSGK